jgi:predicted transporter
MTIVLIIAVSFDSVFAVIFAIIRRVKGARIIGTGILFFCLFILTIFAMALVKGGRMDINDSTVGGQILVIFLALAILSIPVSMSVYLAWNFSSVNQNLFTQLDQVKVLSQKNLEQEQEKQRLLEKKKKNWKKK